MSLAVSKTDEEAFWDWEDSDLFTQDDLRELDRLNQRGQFLYLCKKTWLAACAFKNAQQAAKDAESVKGFDEWWKGKYSLNIALPREAWYAAKSSAMAEIERLKADNAAKDARIRELEEPIKVLSVGINNYGDDLRKKIKELEDELLAMSKENYEDFGLEIKDEYPLAKALAVRELSKQKGGEG